ncbi:MAG: hypothetical protein CM1200mP30_19890 [Pseudomonadota bacterium]|nr:MAG: hypothetical protein CM1200mP30_19890 [Pseudomonadota bacterium]
MIFACWKGPKVLEKVVLLNLRHLKGILKMENHSCTRGRTEKISSYFNNSGLVCEEDFLKILRGFKPISQITGDMSWECPPNGQGIAA